MKTKYLGKHQETISQWENPDYGRHSLSTLKNLASIFDVALMVRFTSFSELVHDMDNLSNERLAPPSYQEDVMNQSTDWSSQLSGVLDRAEDYDAYHNSIGTEGLSSFQSWYFSNNSGSVVLFPIDNLKRKAVNNVA